MRCILRCVAFCLEYVRITTYRNFKYKHDLTYALNMYDKYFKSVYELRWCHYIFFSQKIRSVHIFYMVLSSTNQLNSLALTYDTIHLTFETNINKYVMFTTHLIDKHKIKRCSILFGIFSNHRNVVRICFQKFNKTLHFKHFL